MRYLLLCLLLLSPVLACAPFFPDELPGLLAEEIAVIVWDEKTHTEHFIRQASFATEAKSVGFVVPTPSEPQLSEVDDSLFAALQELTRPKIIIKKERGWQVGFVLNCALAAGAPDGVTGAPIDPVQVYSQGTVAGQEYAVLKASDSEALETWLAVNGFPFPEANVAWVEPYIKKGYFLTAFKYLAEPSQGFSSKTMKMTFKSGKPFYPYSEPESQDQHPERSLRVYVLSSGKVTGALENGPWPAKVPYSAPTNGLPSAVAELTEGTWLTVFDDNSSNRQGLSDLHFNADPNQTETRPPDRTVIRREPIVVPLELIMLLFAGAFIFWRKRAKA